MRPRRAITIRNIRSRDARRELGAGIVIPAGRRGRRDPSAMRVAAEWLSERLRGFGMTVERVMQAGSTIDEAEVARFSALAETWWDPRGEMAVLHKFNPVRLAYIRDATCKSFERNAKQLDCLKGLRILDIGCGGGIFFEPLARLGANVVGADPAEKNIAAAKVHAAKSELAIDYRATTAEALADAGETFDIVLAMEVVEHVADVKLFVSRCADMVRPGGLM